MEFTANHLYIELALRAHRKPFSELEAEMAAFVPLPRSHFEPTQTQIDTIGSANPTMSAADIDAFSSQGSIWRRRSVFSSPRDFQNASWSNLCP